MNFNYDNANNYAKSCGIILLADKLAEFDQMAAAHGFTQAQVDVALQHHVRHIAWIFNTGNFTLTQRIGLALHFLFGRKK